jgi:large subunit ribosomal protein L29
MTLKEMRDKPDEQLEAALRNTRRHLFELRSQSVTESLEDPTQLGKARREIARIKTVLRQRALAAGQSSSQVQEAQPA